MKLNTMKLNTMKLDTSSGSEEEAGGRCRTSFICIESNPEMKIPSRFLSQDLEEPETNFNSQAAEPRVLQSSVKTASVNLLAGSAASHSRSTTPLRIPC